LAHIEANGTVRYYHSDELGSTLALTDETGDVTDQLAYTPYGGVTHTGSTETPCQWLGGYGVYYDVDTQLHLTLHRAYDCSLRRFISTDPMRIDGGVNLYAYGNLNPLAFVDPLGLYVLLEAHPVALGFNHSKVVIIPDDQDSWRDHPDARTFLNGEVYMTIGAGSVDGKLTDGLNRTRDVIRTHNVFSTSVNLPAGMTENQYIGKLLSAHENYQDNAKYVWFPAKSSSSYNSNSYASGLLNATGGRVSQTPPSAPGYAKPLPSSYFQPQTQSEIPANRSSHILK
jgi:RHS repeat-associated protein